MSSALLARKLSSFSFGESRDAYEFEPEIAKPIKYSVQVGLIYNLPNQDGPPTFGPQVHSLKHRREALAQFTPHY